MSDKIKELLIKLKALSERGVGGEKENATKKLYELLKKHNISESELENISINDYYIEIEEYIWKLFYQIVGHTNIDIKVYKFNSKVKKKYKLKGNILVCCSACEYLLICAKFDFYKSLFDEEMKIFMSAFIQAQSLGVKSNEENRSFNENDVRVLQMSLNIKKRDFVPQINKP